MSYPMRVLPPAEWDRVAAHVSVDGRMPQHALARIVVVEDQDQIVGGLVAQLQAHLEPIWLAPAYRGKVQWPRLVTLAAAQLDPGNPYYAFAPDPHIARMCQAVGLTRLPWTVFQGVTPCRK